MRINNLNNKKINHQEGIAYALIFILYTAILVLIFIYAIKFLSTNINLALSTPNSTEIEDKYGQLDLNNYAIIANKLGLKKTAPITTNDIITEPLISTTDLATSSPVEIINPEASSSEIISEPIIEETMPIISETNTAKPKIVIINSTLKSGLAATLKNKLASAGFSVIKTGNSKPSLNSTVIKTKDNSSINLSDLREIKKIVSLNYDYITQSLAKDADYDIEIIIGNR